MSETPTASHCIVRGENRTGSIGLPLPDMDVRIVSLDDGVTEVPIGKSVRSLWRCLKVMVTMNGMPTETSNV